VRQKGFASLLFILLVTVLFVSGMVYYNSKKKDISSGSQNANSQQTGITPTPRPHIITQSEEQFIIIPPMKLLINDKYVTFKIKIPEGWDLENYGYDDGTEYSGLTPEMFGLSLIKDDYILHIKDTAGAHDAGTCLYRQLTKEEQDSNFILEFDSTYKTLQTGFGVLRLGQIKNRDFQGDKINLSTCQFWDKEWSNVTGIDTLWFELPKDYDPKIRQEMENIVTGIKVIPL
jgi:hypothetical protein